MKTSAIKLYSVAFSLLRWKVINDIKEGDEALVELRTQLTNEFTALKEKLTRLPDTPLKLSFTFMQTALNFAEHNKFSDANEHFRLCQEMSVDAVTSSESFHFKCVATRMRIMCTLYLCGYFSSTRDIDVIKEECKKALDRLFEEPEVRTAIRDQFEAESKTTRPTILVELADLLNAVDVIVGSECSKLTDKHGAPVYLKGIQVPIVTDHAKKLTALVVTGDCLFTGSEDKTIKAWDLCTLSCVGTLTGHTYGVTSLAVNVGRLFSGSRDDTIRVWDLLTFSCVATLTGHTRGVSSLAISGGRLYSGSEDGAIKLWNLSNLECVTTLTGHARPVSLFCCSCCVTCLVVFGDRLYSGSENGAIKVWDLSTLSCIATITGHTGGVACLVVSDDRLFSGSGDGTIKAWDLTSLFCLDTYNGHFDGVTSFVVCGGFLYSGSDDWSIKMWNMSTMTIVTTLKMHFSGVSSLFGSGNRLYSGSGKDVKMLFL